MARKTSLPADLQPGMRIEYKGAHMTETATVERIGEVVQCGDNPVQIIEGVRLTTSVPSLVGTSVTLYLPALKRVRFAQQS